MWYNVPAMLPAGSIAGTLYHKLYIIPQDCIALQTEVMKDNIL
jgi:hypothetical protein